MNYYDRIIELISEQGQPQRKTPDPEVAKKVARERRARDLASAQEKLKKARKARKRGSRDYKTIHSDLTKAFHLADRANPDPKPKN